MTKAQKRRQNTKILKKHLSKGPWPSKKMETIIVSKKTFKVGYILQTEIEDIIDMSGKEYRQSLDRFLVLHRAYTPEGDWLGSSREARFFTVKLGLTKIQKTNPDHCVCSIGFNEKEQKWYGWSHRAYCGFGKGDKIFIDGYGDEHTLFTQHGRTPINFMRQAKTAAKRFARSVS